MVEQQTFQLFDELSPEEYTTLKESIARNGVLVPVEYDQDGNLLDGHHRKKIADSLGIDCPAITRTFDSEDARLEHVLIFNVDRRNLTPEQRTRLEARLRSRGWSYRRIAERIGVDAKTVRNDIPGGEYSPPGSVVGKDGKSYPATMPRAGGSFTDDTGDSRPVTEVEETDDEVIVHSDEDALVVGKEAFVPNKVNLGNNVSHPARFSSSLIETLAAVLGAYDVTSVLDPFAGTGRVHELEKWDYETTGVEIETEWASLHPRTIRGDALKLRFRDSSFDAIVTSPTYGNRLADHHNASDPESRRSYTHDLGHELHQNNSGQLQWGDKYKAFHLLAWSEALRVLTDGGVFILNVKDHRRAGQWQYVSGWHVTALCRLGLELQFHIEVDSPSMRAGENRESRQSEQVYVFLKAVA